MVLTPYMIVESGVYIDVSKKRTASIFLRHAGIYLQVCTVSKPHNIIVWSTPALKAWKSIHTTIVFLKACCTYIYYILHHTKGAL
jgi:hypothetical protein